MMLYFIFLMSQVWIVHARHMDIFFVIDYLHEKILFSKAKSEPGFHLHVILIKQG